MMQDRTVDPDGSLLLYQALGGKATRAESQPSRELALMQARVSLGLSCRAVAVRI